MQNRSLLHQFPVAPTRFVLALCLICFSVGIRGSAQSLDIRTELRNQLRFLEIQRDEYDHTFVGRQLELQRYEKDGQDYLRDHQMAGFAPLLHDPELDLFGSPWFAFMISLGQQERDEQTERIVALKETIRHVISGQEPGYSVPSPNEAARGRNVLGGIQKAEDVVESYTNACDRDDWMRSQIKSTISRADDIEELIKQMYQAHDEEQRRQAQLALERAKRAAEEQRRQLARELHDHPTPDEFRHDHHDGPSGGVSRPQRDAFPLDRQQRDVIGGIMNALDHEAHQDPERMP